MKSKKIIALAIASTLMFQSSFASISVNAAEVEKNTETTEYIVQVKDEEALEEVLDDNKKAVVEDSNVEELEEQQMTVLELTEKDAEKLLKDKDVILVEENIVLEASTVTDFEVIDEEEEIIEEQEENTESSESETTETLTEAIIDEQLTEENSTEKDCENKVQKKEKSNKKGSNKKNKEKETLPKENKTSKIKVKEMLDRDESELQWNLSAIHLPENKGEGEVIKVAVLDSGVSYDEDLPISERIMLVDGVEVENVLFDDTTGHGTGVASIIGAQDNGRGIRGINPNAEIYSIQILNENNQTNLCLRWGNIRRSGL